VAGRFSSDKVARSLLLLQIPLVAIATGLLGIVGWKLPPMLEQYRTLQQQIPLLDREIAERTQTLDQLKVLIEESADKRTKDGANKIFANSSLQGFTAGIYYLSSDDAPGRKGVGP
jgi:hypothetical protein